MKPLVSECSECVRVFLGGFRCIAISKPVHRPYHCALTHQKCVILCVQVQSEVLLGVSQRLGMFAPERAVAI